MPKNTKTKGHRMPDEAMTNVGTWIKSKFAGMRIGKNTVVSDHHCFGLHRKSKRTHTSPVQRTEFNDGHDAKVRIRHAATKAAHVARHMAHASME